MTKTLYWLTQDLRTSDNAALRLAANSDSLLCIYLADPARFVPHRYHLVSMGRHRWQFIRQSLTALSTRLRALGQHLYISYETPLEGLARLVARHDIDRLVCSRQTGFDERQALTKLRRRCPALRIDVTDTYTLHDEQALPFAVEACPKHFAEFRSCVEHTRFPKPIPAIESLPPLPGPVSVVPLPGRLDNESATSGPFEGGEQAAQAHLTSYFGSAAPSTYQSTRNALDGWQNSSKLSAWLSQGCVSARQVLSAIGDYEFRHGSNESSRHLRAELLWREFFQWSGIKLGKALFRFEGAYHRKPLTSFYSGRFRKWCEGRTPYPLVNACMRELRQTGYLSNRGRQVAASALVNELATDWRYGAAWFEQQLVDYDVNSNWGNWQYIAGVGADPRGGRHFNLEKQARQYDPNGDYVRRWADDAQSHTLDSVDAADWPVSPPHR